MLLFLLGLIIGANVSLVFYAMIVAGARGETKDERRE